jgi:hypothetical protein
MNYSKLSNNDIFKYDTILYDKHCEFWDIHASDLPPSPLSDALPYDKIACMTPGDFQSILSGRFLLEKTTGGALRKILDQRQCFPYKHNPLYKRYLIIHRTTTPWMFIQPDGQLHLYYNSTSESVVHSKQCHYKTAIHPTRVYMADTENIQHHEYFLVYHNEVSMKIFDTDPFEKLCECLVKDSTRHDISVEDRTPSSPTEPCPLRGRYTWDEPEDRIFVLYMKCLIVINAVFVCYFAIFTYTCFGRIAQESDVLRNNDSRIICP